MRVADITRMTRSGDPKYPAVRVAYFGSVVSGAVAIAYGLVANDSFSLANTAAVVVAAFLGWAIARELDPDHSITAMVALAGAAFLAVWQVPSLLLSAVALGAFRLLVGTVGGGGPTTLDRMVMVGLAAYAAIQPEGWMLVVVIAIGLLMAGGTHRFWWALLVVVGAAGAALVWGEAPPVSYDEGFFVFVSPPLIILLLLLLLLLALPVSPTSTTDIGKQPLNPRHLQLARFLSGLVVLGSVLVLGEDGLTTLGPVTGAVVATGLSAVLWGRSGPGRQTSEVS